jgi:hypothetical protein
MFCNNCEKENSAENNYCKYCGTRLNFESPDTLENKTGTFVICRLKSNFFSDLDLELVVDDEEGELIEFSENEQLELDLEAGKHFFEFRLAHLSSHIAFEIEEDCHIEVDVKTYGTKNDEWLYYYIYEGDDKYELASANPEVNREIALRNQEQEAQMLSLKMQKQLLNLQSAQHAAMAKCPRCGSTSLSGNKKGYGIGKAVIGTALLGPIGLIAGNINARRVYVTCLNCGKRFII